MTVRGKGGNSKAEKKSSLNKGGEEKLRYERKDFNNGEPNVPDHPAPYEKGASKDASRE